MKEKEKEERGEKQQQRRHGCIIGSSDQTFIHITLHSHLLGKETTTVGQIENTNREREGKSHIE